MILYSLHGHHRPPSIDEAAAKLGVPAAALDSDYGVVLLDPARGVYCVALKEDANPSAASERDGVGGPWTDPQIGAFRPTPDGRPAPPDSAAR